MKYYNKTRQILERVTQLTLHDASYKDLKRLTDFVPISLLEDGDLRILLNYRAEYNNLDGEGERNATL